MKNLRPFLASYVDYKWGIVLVMILSLAAGFAEAAMLVTIVPVAAALIEGTDSVLINYGPIDRRFGLDTLLFIAGGFVVADMVIQILAGYVSSVISGDWTIDKRLEVYRAYFNASWSTQTRDRGGKLVTVTGTNIFKGAQGVKTITAMSRGLFGLVMFVAVALIVDPMASIATTVFGTILLLVLRPISAMAKTMTKRISRLNVGVADEISDYVSLSRELRIFDGETAALDHLDEKLAEVKSLTVRSGFITSVPSPLYRGATTLAVIGIALFAVDQDSIDAAKLGAVAVLLYRSISYGQMLQGAYTSMITTLPFMEHLEEDIKEYKGSPTTDGPETIDTVNRLVLDNVSYAYDDEGTALTEFSAEFRRGEKVGVVGPSGSGKSTLAQIILRLRLPDEGRVLANDLPYEQISASSWYANVALVPQEAKLLQDSVSANIRFYRDDLSDADVVAAATAAGIHDTIMLLPQGYDTEVGAAVRDLSGGQIQRIAIARALAGSPSVIVMDEPTSALDVGSEAIIQETIANLGTEVLVVVIAHRLTTLTVCDRLLVLESGRLVNEGPPDQILSSPAFSADQQGLGT